MEQETIVAIATPPGRGGVAIVRLSGPLSYQIAQKIAARTTITPRQAYFASFHDQHQVLLDKGLLLYFKAPHSFTGEEVVEFHCHGAPFVLDRLIEECIAQGARLAQPGEFSLRAFINEKIDLTQAEAIADLIHASSETAARMAVRSLQGDFSKQIQSLSEKIIHLRLYVEAAIDFPEEEIDFLSDGKVADRLNSILSAVSALLANARQGSLLREGLTLVIAGKPNAGKSTLINLLSGREIAIVTELAGTTRDVMREQILLDDIPIHIIDTAGLRESSDIVEQEGIKRAWREVKNADCVLLVLDATQSDAELNAIYQSIKTSIASHIPIIKIFNKIDKIAVTPKAVGQTIFLCAKTGDGLQLLKEQIKSVVGFQPTEGQFIARRRHLDALVKAKQALETGKNQLHTQRAGELLAEDLRLAHQYLCEITGEFSSDDLLGEIFSNFCIGK